MAPAAEAASEPASPNAALEKGASMEFEVSESPMSAMLPATRYFEVESSIVGATFGVWVTTPPRYDAESDTKYPAIYQPDGNVAAPLTAPAALLLPDDPINPIQPFIQVSVGYVGQNAQQGSRARDLVPPGEPLSIGVDESSMEELVQAGMLDAEGAELYLHYLRNPAADNFLAFLTDELHPLVTEQFRVDDDALGLHGYSYGGLFATYAALRRTPFRRIGAGSAAIPAARSTVFECYKANLASGADHSGRMLHMTVCEQEITAASVYQPLVGAGTVEFISRAQQTPLTGLAFSTKIIPEESHATGLAASWFSFLRTCYAASAPSALLTAKG